LCKYNTSFDHSFIVIFAHNLVYDHTYTTYRYVISVCLCSESGIRISGELQRGGFVRNVTFRNLSFNWATLQKKTFLLSVQQNYPNGGTNPPCMYPNGTACPIPKFGPNRTNPDFHSIRFENITILHAPPGLNVGQFDCAIADCRDISFDGIRLVDAPTPNGLTCQGLHGEQHGVDAGGISTNKCHISH
jgi:hypothetical protein